MTTNTAKRCKATKRDGRPCQAWSVAGSEFCFWHDPARAADRARASANGGHARHGRHLVSTDDGEPVSVADVADVLALLERAVNDVLTLENSIARARALGYLAGAALRALEVGQLEQRLEALEVILNEDLEDL